jgi:hypothetical protein
VITPRVAIDQVVERMIFQHLGSSATAKNEVEAALRDRLTEDPLLAAKMRALTQT